MHAVADLVRTAQPRCGATVVVAIDGPSGAGKTTYAAALAGLSGGPPVLHMDDFYVGWDGLVAGVRRLAVVLATLATGAAAHYRPYDWSAGQLGPETVLQPPALLLVEGAGAGGLACAPYESALIWLDADPAERRRRALARDGAMFAPHWERWAAQEAAHFAADRTRERADVVRTS